jgi:drug resistance transporter, emrB/qacA subfamily protein
VRTLGGVAVGLSAMGLFMAVERRSDLPMVPGRLLTDRLYVVSILTGFAVQAGLVGQMPWLLLYAQNIYLLSPLQAGLCFLPFSLCTIAGAWLGRLPESLARFQADIGSMHMSMKPARFAGQTNNWE